MSANVKKYLYLLVKTHSVPIVKNVKGWTKI